MTTPVQRQEECFSMREKENFPTSTILSAHNSIHRRVGNLSSVIVSEPMLQEDAIPSSRYACFVQMYEAHPDRQEEESQFFVKTQ